MIEARYHDRVNVLQELFEDGSCNGAPSPFDRAEWYALLEDTGLSPFIAMASDGKHSAALPLVIETGRASSLRNWYSFTWRPLAPTGETGCDLLRELARLMKTKAHRVTFEPVPDEDGSATDLAMAFQEIGWRVEVTECDTNHFLHAQGQSFSEYWADRPGPLRTTLKRKGKKVATEIRTQFDDAAWAEYEQIYSESWKPEEDQPTMLREFARQEGAAGRLRLGIARHKGQAVAAQFWTVERGTAYIHKLAHLKSAQSLSAGTTLSAALFEHAIDIDKVDLIDFGTGDQPYKADWMNGVRPRFRIDCLDLAQPKAWFDLARQTLRRLNDADVPKLAHLPPPR